jgi:hypothetical protein
MEMMMAHTNSELTYKDLSDRFHGLGPEDPEGHWGRKPQGIEEQLAYDRHRDRVAREAWRDWVEQRLIVSPEPPGPCRENILRYVSKETLQAARRRHAEQLQKESDAFWLRYEDQARREAAYTTRKDLGAWNQ